MAARLALLLALLTLSAAPLGARRDFGAEPLFNEPDGDIHTVTVGSDQRPSRVSPVASPSSSLPQISAVQTSSHRGLPQPISPSSPNRQLVELKRSNSSMAKRQISSAVNQPDGLSLARQRYPKQVAPPSHWSSLMEYYKKIQSQAGARPDEYDTQQIYLTEVSPPQSQSAPAPGLPLAILPIQDGFSFDSQTKATSRQQQAVRQAHIPPTCKCDGDGAIKSFGPSDQQIEDTWPEDDFPMLLSRDYVRAMQSRTSKQVDVLGPSVSQPTREQVLQDELNCGPRNRVRSAASRRYAQQMAVAAAAGFGEYPSHMGLYNSSQPSDDNFLCSATLVHPRFALTLASCLVVSNSNYNLTTATAGGTAQPKLTVQAGEWNINRGTPSQRQAAMTTRPVTRVHPFPRFNPQQPGENNLALVEWAKALDVDENIYTHPACQVDYRSSLRMLRCFAPIRNVTWELAYDPNGDGETKLEKQIQMAEMPVSLIAHDDAKCSRQTKVEYFNLQHPNQICTGDFKRSQWRNMLKQSEYLGSGVYCNENGIMNLVSMIPPVSATNATTTDENIGYIDLSFYRPWIRSVISASSMSSQMSSNG